MALYVQRSLLPLSAARRQENLRTCILYYRSLYSTLGRLSIPILRFLHFLHAPTQIPRIVQKNMCRRALVAIPKPEKPLGDLKRYSPKSLQYAPFKIVKRLTYAHIEPIINHYS